MAGLNSKTKLLLHGDGADGGTVFPDSSNSGHTLTPIGATQIDTDQSKFGGASILFDGDSDNLSAPDSADWDVFGTTDNWTVDFWVKHVDHAGLEYYVWQYEDGSNYWKMDHTDGQGIGVQLVSAGTGLIIGTGAEITDTDWHHVALCKVGTEYGIYLDGTQGVYLASENTDTFAGSLIIGANIDGAGQQLDGHLDEIRVQNSNYFNAAPNATPDDTITVPTAAYSKSASGGAFLYNMT